MSKSVAENYEKLKRFITDVTHELKTPLTLMLTNVDILESEIGKNEWLEDIRLEGNKMTELINQLVCLARMDEDTVQPPKALLNLSEMVSEMATLFQPLAAHKNLTLTASITPEVFCFGQEAELRRLLSILTENALKYCDAGGSITITLQGGKSPTFWIDNHYEAVGTLRLDLLFDRFYRWDSARVSGKGFGIGLSIAKAIAERHGAQIWAQNLNGTMIRFGVKWKKPPAFSRITQNPSLDKSNGT